MWQGGSRPTNGEVMFALNIPITFERITFNIRDIISTNYYTKKKVK